MGKQDLAKVYSKRQAKLDKYRQERDEITAELKSLNNRRSRLSERLRNVSNAIYDLLHESDEVPSVADHAIVRYLERVKGMDIQALKIEVANHKQAQREGNVIVTVNPEATDDGFDWLRRAKKEFEGELATPDEINEIGDDYGNEN